MYLNSFKVKIIQMKFFALYLILFLICSCTLGIPQPDIIKTESKKDQPEISLHGAWMLTMDDEYTGQTFPDEMLYFHKDGQLLVDGQDFICGRYDVIGDQIQIIAPVKGHEVAYFRKFILDQNGLHLKNIHKGFAHYQPMKGMVELCIPDEQWKLQAIGYFSFKAPQDWSVLGEAPKKDGIQEVRIMNPDASKLLLAVRLPVDMGYPQQEVIKITREIASKLIQDTPMAGFQLKPAGVNNYFGITGTTFLAETKTPPLTLKVIIKRLQTSAVIIYTLYSSDLLMELENVAQLIYVDNVPVLSE
ncbi:MAG: hypothetical protein C0403_08575 [Desulfobacterium sp.]|nr:hypothetical protein [Desulfobacterium sp.]